MTCEWAEGNLSAYLDDALDPQLRKEVGAHIEQCAHCQALATEYRRNDQFIATLAPLTPPDALRQRIFESPEFAALSRELDREAANPPPALRVSRRVPLYLRVFVPAAALLTISLGAALLFKQGLLPFGASTASQTQTHTIGGPGSFALPLSAGPRLVYLNGGALWSVAQYAPSGANGAPGIPQQLTAPGARVAGWSVSPLATRGGGARIAYVDARTGALHIVHSDGQADTIIGAVTPTQSPSAAFWASPAGHAALSGLTWSPDGSQLAYVVARTDGRAEVHVYQLDGASASIATTRGASVAQLTWSADGHALAFITGVSGAQTLTIWRGAGSPTTLPASPADPHATIAQMAWSGSTLTWSTVGQDGAITGVYSLKAGDSAATQLTSNGASYSAAAFTPAQGGAWLIAGDGALMELRLTGGGATQVAALPTTVSHITWAPNGKVTALQLGDQLALWNSATGLTTIASGVAAQPAPVWSADSSALVVARSQSVSVYHVNGSSIEVAQLTGDASPLALAWSADGRAIAIAETHGTLLATSDGARQTLLTSHQADNGVVNWSIAG